MDTSKKYIDMCGQAKEIQDMRRGSYDANDFCACDGLVFLPRQDQLQKHLGHFDKCLQTILNFKRQRIHFDSFEQLWLALLMEIKFNKRWDFDKNEWVGI